MDPVVNVLPVAAAAAVTGINESIANKRKRSPSVSSAVLPVAPPAKMTKTSPNSQLSINYLARQSAEDIPLLNKDDTLPNLLALLSQYGAVLDRHESLASNLGARPLGPILIKRFERCFDAPPRIVASHLKTAANGVDDDSHLITWLEVIEFARSHPGQFLLDAFSEGRRVCQFYYPQERLRAQISAEDWLFINSGRCQELIPPLPIWEDEEKEVGACDVLDHKLKELTNIADVVAARTRQLSHRLKGRKAAILERRAEGGSGTPAKATAQQTTTAPPPSTDTNFTTSSHMDSSVRATDEPYRNGTTGLSHSRAVQSDLLRHFESLPQNQNQAPTRLRHPSMTGFHELSDTMRLDSNNGLDRVSIQDRGVSTYPSLSPDPAYSSAVDTSALYGGEGGAVNRTPTAPGNNQIVHRPGSSTGGNNQTASSTLNKHNFSRPLAPGLESSQPFRPLCQAHMDGLPRGHRVIPPCDRCRRLRMDCVKNLTSCAGCTKKHARCHWRDVTRDELGALDHLLDTSYTETADGGNNGYANGQQHHSHQNQQDDSEDDDSNPLEDLEALVEKEERERATSGPPDTQDPQPVTGESTPSWNPCTPLIPPNMKDGVVPTATQPSTLGALREPIDDSTIQVVPRKAKSDDMAYEATPNTTNGTIHGAPNSLVTTAREEVPSEEPKKWLPSDPTPATTQQATSHTGSDFALMG